MTLCDRCDPNMRASVHRYARTEADAIRTRDELLAAGWGVKSIELLQDKPSSGPYAGQYEITFGIKEGVAAKPVFGWTKLGVKARKHLASAKAHHRAAYAYDEGNDCWVVLDERGEVQCVPSEREAMGKTAPQAPEMGARSPATLSDTELISEYEIESKRAHAAGGAVSPEGLKAITRRRALTEQLQARGFSHGFRGWSRERKVVQETPAPEVVLKTPDKRRPGFGGARGLTDSERAANVAEVYRKHGIIPAKEDRPGFGSNAVPTSTEVQGEQGLPSAAGARKSKYTQSQVAEVQRLKKEGQGVSAISAKTGIPKGSVMGMLDGRIRGSGTAQDTIVSYSD